MNELTIKPKDWVGIFLIGLSFSAFLSILAYRLLGLPMIEGGWFGILLGFFITLFSFLFITGMNRFLLPRVSRIWWDLIAILFSFLSGYLGTWSAHLLMIELDIMEVALLKHYPHLTASVIGILTYLIGALNYRFVKTRNEKERLNTLWMQSRIRSLETQLNPHFLFNALNSLAELIHHNPDEAEKAVLKISSFLRSTMKESTLIPLSEEIRNLQEYIDLENLRFGSPIVFNITGDIPAVIVPKFSIQLLCENAIKHGYRGNSPLTIHLDIHQENGLKLSVTNNGKPITNTRFGIGLSNLRERLHHLCSGELHVESQDPPSYTLTLKECHENPDRR